MPRYFSTAVFFVAIIEQYELAYRMQVSVPEVMDISREPQKMLDLYGARPGFIAASDAADDPRIAFKGNDATFANSCLLARRLVERGVRFIQIFDWGWDHHGSSPGETIDKNLPIRHNGILAVRLDNYLHSCTTLHGFERIVYLI